MVETEQGKERLITLNFVVLFLTTYFVFFASDFFIPVLPFYVVEAGGTKTAVGLLMGLFTFTSIVLRPLQGSRIHRTGCKKMLLLGIIVYALGGLGLAALPPLPAFFFFRAAQGFGWGSYLLAFNTLAVDLAPPGRKGEAVSLIGIAPPLSLATAPFLGELIFTAHGSFITVFLISVAVALVALGLSLVIKEPRSCQGQLPQAQPALYTPKVLLPSIMIFFITFTYGGMITFLPLLNESRSLPLTGPFFIVFAVIAAAVRSLCGRLSDRYGRASVFLPGLVLLSISLIIISLADTPGLLLLGAFFFSCGMNSTHPTILALAADSVAEAERGVGMATFTLAFDAGISAGATALGLLLRWFDYAHIFLFCAGIALLPLAIYYLGRKGPGTEQP